MKPLLIGMNNPQGNEPLWPEPRGCTGHYIWKMINSLEPLLKKDYTNVFDRHNLVADRTWNAAVAYAARDATWELMRGRQAVLLGKFVPAALGITRPPAGVWVGQAPGRFTCIPHPSGRNLWYNDPNNKKLVAELLTGLYREALLELRYRPNQEVSDEG